MPFQMSWSTTIRVHETKIVPWTEISCNWTELDLTSLTLLEIMLDY